MAEQNDNPGTSRSGGEGGRDGGGSGAGSGASSGNNRNRNRSRSRNRNRPAGSGGGGGNSSSGTGGGGGGGGGGSGQSKSQSNARSGGGGRGGSSGGSGSGGGGRAGSGGGGGGSQRSGQQNRGGGKGANRSRSRSGGSSSSSGSSSRSRSGQPRSAVALAPTPPPEPLDIHPGLGAPQVFPAEVAANRRRAIRLCAWTAVVPAVLIGILLGVSVNLIVGIVALVVVGAAVMYGLWRFAPSFALRRIGAVPVDEQDDPRLSNLTEGLCATFGLAMPALFVVDDDVPNACALGRDARRSDVVVTSGLLRRADPIELEGVLAHELAHVKRGDNGVSCVGITLGSLLGGERMLRRCVGESREYRADVVGASAVRYPRGLLSALRLMVEAPAPAEGSLFATPSRFGSTRWIWIDPSVGHRDDPLEPGDLDATSVRAAALSEW